MRAVTQQKTLDTRSTEAFTSHTSWSENSHQYTVIVSNLTFDQVLQNKQTPLDIFFCLLQFM
jgi:hypothetical protein